MIHIYICTHPFTCHTAAYSPRTRDAHFDLLRCTFWLTAYSPRTRDAHFDSLISAHRRSDSFLACHTNADSSRTGHAHFDSFIFAQRRLEPFFCTLYECIQPTNWRRAYWLIRMFLTHSCVQGLQFLCIRTTCKKKKGSERSSANEWVKMRMYSSWAVCICVTCKKRIWTPVCRY